MSTLKVYPWWKLPSDIAEAEGWIDAALEELAKSQAEKDKRRRECCPLLKAADDLLHSEAQGWSDAKPDALGQAIKRNMAGLIMLGYGREAARDCVHDALIYYSVDDELDEDDRDPVQVAAQTPLRQLIYKALTAKRKRKRLQAYCPDASPMPYSVVLERVPMLKRVCVEPDSLNALLKANGYRGDWDPEGAAPAQNQPINVLPGKTSHKQRGNSLDTAISKAIKEAGCDKPAAVYMALHELALNGNALPFTGAREGGSLCYTNDNDKIACLTKDALGKRLSRLRKAV